jgi:DNA-binding transcriptional MerR regulator
MSKSPPAAPDYTGAAEKQAESSREVTEQQTWANRPDQITPFGNQTWQSTPTKDPTTGQMLNRWTQTTTLDPQMQAALDDQQMLQQQRSGLAGSMYDRVASEYGAAPPDYSKYESLGSTPQAMSFGGGDKYSKEAGDAIYGQFESRNEPQFQRAQDAKRTQLYNMGLKEGDEAYDNAMSDLGQSQQDARLQAQYQATVGAGAEASRMQGMDISAGQAQYGQQMQSSNYQNQLRQQQIAEDMQRRGYSLNEINAILTGQQVGMPNMPSFNQAAASQATQYSNAAQQQGQADLDRFNAQQQATQGMMSGIGSMAGGAMMFSRTEYKEFYKTGVNREGRNIYLFRYNWDEEGLPFRTGIMIEENPDIQVHTDPMTGKQMIDYSDIDFEIAEAA